MGQSSRAAILEMPDAVILSSNFQHFHCLAATYHNHLPKAALCFQKSQLHPGSI